MPLATNSISGCCVSTNWYNLGNAHGHPRAKDQDEFDQRFINLRAVNDVNIALTNDNQAKEREYLTAQGWDTVQHGHMWCSSIEGTKLRRYLDTAVNRIRENKRKKLSEIPEAKRPRFSDKLIDMSMADRDAQAARVRAQEERQRVVREQRERELERQRQTQAERERAAAQLRERQTFRGEIPDRSGAPLVTRRHILELVNLVRTLGPLGQHDRVLTIDSDHIGTPVHPENPFFNRTVDYLREINRVVGQAYGINLGAYNPYDATIANYARQVAEVRRTQRG